MDKDARAIRGWELLGFGFAELGTVTPLPQAGNPRPRLWRLPQEQALINCLGFPSAGMEVVARRLRRLRARGVRIRLGISLGPNRTTPREHVARDYQALIEHLAPLADFVVINLSSPNTPGLRELQGAHEIRSLLGAILEAKAAASNHAQIRAGFLSNRPTEVVQPTVQTAASAQDPIPIKREAVSVRDSISDINCPLLVKLGPDMEQSALEHACDALLEMKVDGVVACNTTTARSSLVARQVPEGGLSGQPLTLRARKVIRTIYRRTHGQLPIVGVGGISAAADAYAHIGAGASLIELYTGLVFQGPALVAQIKRELCTLLTRDGFKSIAEAAGTQA
jgi:dihydroorotate dehydrogenase